MPPARFLRLPAIAGLVAALLVAHAAAAQKPPGQLPIIQTPPPGVPSFPSPPATPANNGVIVGVVADAATGRGVAGALVTLAGRGSSQRRLTDGKGRFYFRNVVAGDASITAVRDGYFDGAYGKLRPDGSGIALTLVDGQWATNIRIDLWRPATIDGHVVDDAGEPVIGAQVRALRREFVAGRPQLVPRATKLTDDLGLYRLTGLEPGEYLVTIPAVQASAPVAAIEAIAQTGNVGSDITLLAAIARSAGGLASAENVVIDADGKSVTLSRTVNQPPVVNGRTSVYPTVFYPGVVDAWAGQSVVVAAGENRRAVDFQLMPVQTARVSGRLIGTPAARALQLVRLLRVGDEDLGAGGETALTLAASDGTFTFPAVPLGAYTLKASTARGSGPLVTPAPAYWGDASVWVLDRDVEDVEVVMQPGATLTGRVAFEGAAPVPTAEALSRAAIEIESADGRREPLSAAVNADGEFAVPGVLPGQYFVRPRNVPAGWTLESAMWVGRDLSDEPLEVWSGADVADVVVTFTDLPAQVNGTVRDARGGFTSSATVIVMPADRPGLTDYGANPRRLRCVRAAPSGVFSIDGLPPGDYALTAIDEADAGNWQDPQRLDAWRRTATTVRLQSGDRKIQDLRLLARR